VGPGRGAADRQVHHPLGCHRPRIPDRLVFDKLIQILVFGCGYRRIADATCSATTLRRRRDEWISAGVAEQLRLLVLAAYDRLAGCSAAPGPNIAGTAALAAAHDQLLAQALIGALAGRHGETGARVSGRLEYDGHPHLPVVPPHPQADVAVTRQKDVGSVGHRLHERPMQRANR
jgi:transposase